MRLEMGTGWMPLQLLMVGGLLFSRADVVVWRVWGGVVCLAGI